MGWVGWDYGKWTPTTLGVSYKIKPSLPPGLYLECGGWGVIGEQGVPSPRPSFSFPPSPPFLRSRPSKIQLGTWRSAVSSPFGVWGRDQPTNDLVHFRIKI